MFQFFNLLTRFHPIDEDYFTNCALGVSFWAWAVELDSVASVWTDVVVTDAPLLFLTPHHLKLRYLQTY